MDARIHAGFGGVRKLSVVDKTMDSAGYPLFRVILTRFSVVKLTVRQVDVPQFGYALADLSR